MEVHFLRSALVGANDFIDFDLVTQTIAFIRNYSQIALMPLPHRNTIKFFGMGVKSDYLIWRQQDGCFTALDQSLRITTWSTVSGKILKSQSIGADGDEDDQELAMPAALGGEGTGSKLRKQPTLLGKAMRGATEQYELYKAKSDDKTYMGNLTDMEGFSYSLVISKQPCDDDPMH